MKVPFLDLKIQYKNIKNEIDEAIKKVLENTNFIMGEQVKNFEKKLSEYTGAKHAIAVASGSDALLLSLMASGIKEGDEIITTTYTFFATAGAIARLGAKPVFVDIFDNDCNIDVSLIENKITDKTKAIIPVHLYGKCANMDEILKIAKKYGLKIIEDACQAIGSKYKFEDGSVKQAGTMGDLGCFSFFPSKNLGAYGDAGAVITNNDELAEKIRILRVHGSKPKYYHKVVGINSRMDTIQAAILEVKIKYLNDWTKKRINLAKNYVNAFKNNSKIKTYGFFDYDFQHIYHQFMINIENRDELKEFLLKNEIGCAVYYPVPLHAQECFSYLKNDNNDFKIANEKAKTILALPIFPEMTEKQQNFVIDKISEFLN
jgi:dTDP-4-amino-4,6-dideoxygalactose transaminase